MRCLKFLLIFMILGCIDTKPRPKPLPPNPHVEPDVKPDELIDDKKDLEPTPRPGKIRVLIVEERGERINPKMRPCLNTLNSVRIREYLDSHCESVEGDSGWLWVGAKANLDNAPSYWREAYSLPRETVPWIYITNGTTGTSGPLSCDEDENLELLKKWGGP